MPEPFTLGWFTNYLVPDWTGTWAGTGGTDWADGTFAVDIVRKFERAGIDFVMLEDSTALTDIFGGTFESELKWTPRAPKHDPMALWVMGKAQEAQGKAHALYTDDQMIMNQLEECVLPRLVDWVGDVLDGQCGPGGERVRHTPTL